MNFDDGDVEALLEHSRGSTERTVPPMSVCAVEVAKLTMHVAEDGLWRRWEP
jgi:hypothetical protein